jgi:hypothetical protein
MSEVKFINMGAEIGIDRKEKAVKMVFNAPVGGILSFTAEEAEKTGLSLIGRAAILKDIIHEEISQKVPVEKL